MIVWCFLCVMLVVVHGVCYCRIPCFDYVTMFVIFYYSGESFDKAARLMGINQGITIVSCIVIVL